MVQSGGGNDAKSKAQQPASLAPRSFLSAWMVHAPLHALAESRPKAKVSVIYPDAIRCTNSAKGLPFAGVNGLVQTGHSVLAPLHVRGDHWVLLSLSCSRIRICTHTAGEATKVLVNIKRGTNQ
eukprot:PhM_4_TR409/c0_g1_i1/m.76027